jgi:hypothetical protein
VEQANDARRQLRAIRQKLTEGTLAASVDQVEHKLETLVGAGGRRPGAGTDQPSLAGMRTRYLALFNVFQEADVPPSTQAAAGVKEVTQQLRPLMTQWEAIKSHDLPALNSQLKQANLPEVTLKEIEMAAQATAASNDKDEE